MNLSETIHISFDIPHWVVIVAAVLFSLSAISQFAMVFYKLKELKHRQKREEFRRALAKQHGVDKTR